MAFYFILLKKHYTYKEDINEWSDYYEKKKAIANIDYNLLMLNESKEIWDIENLESSDEEDNDSGLDFFFN